MGALQLATHGSWGGSWESKYSAYLVTKILGVTATSASKSHSAARNHTCSMRGSPLSSFPWLASGCETKAPTA